MLTSLQAFSQHIDNYWAYETDTSTIHYEKIDTSTNIVLARGEFVNRLRHGEWKGYWPDGSLQKTIHFNLGVKVGTWKFYDRNGKLVFKKKFKKGKLIMVQERRYY